MLKLDLIGICVKTHSNARILFSPLVLCFDICEPHLFLFWSKTPGGGGRKYDVSQLQSFSGIPCPSCANTPDKPAHSVTMGCPVQRHSGVKPAGSASPKVTEFTPKLAPFSLKTHGAPERLTSFHTLQARGDLLPWYTAHINISSTCHHPVLWGGLFKEGAVHALKIYTLLYMMKHHTQLVMGFLLKVPKTPKI